VPLSIPPRVIVQSSTRSADLECLAVVSFQQSVDPAKHVGYDFVTVDFVQHFVASTRIKVMRDVVDASVAIARYEDLYPFKLLANRIFTAGKQVNGQIWAYLAKVDRTNCGGCVDAAQTESLRSMSVMSPKLNLGLIVALGVIASVPADFVGYEADGSVAMTWCRLQFLSSMPPARRSGSPVCRTRYMFCRQLDKGAAYAERMGAFLTAIVLLALAVLNTKP